jgi:Secretion system C-terminal sorting domain/Receptor L domain
MNKHSFLILIFSFSLSIAFAQICPSGGITFTTQSQIDNFVVNYPSCNEIRGNILIQTPYPSDPFNTIVNLNGLRNITSIVGNLKISSNYTLSDTEGLSALTTIGGELNVEYNSITNINGLRNLTNVGTNVTLFRNNFLLNLDGLSGLTIVRRAMTISNNDKLTNLEGLNHLTTVAGQIFIGSNFVLSNLNGLRNLTLAGGLNLSSNYAMTSLSGLSSLTSLKGNLLLQFCDNFTNLDGLNGLTLIEGNLYIAYNNKLLSLNGLSNVNKINGYISINNNSLLSNLNSLSNVTSIGNFLTVSGNNALLDISGLQNINPTTIKNTNPSMSNLYLTNNPSLSTCNILNICTLISEAGTTTISGNALGCNSTTQIQAACTALPIELLSFTAKSQSNTNLLTWQTATETNSKSFEIEKSNNGKAWQNIGIVVAKGSHSSYEFVDNAPYPISYYRLNQIDTDGKNEYSKTVSINNPTNPKKTKFTINPNPATSVVNLTFSNSEKGSITIVDALGRVVHKKTIQSTAETNLEQWNTEWVARGLYFVTFSFDNQVSTLKVMLK